MRADAGDGKGDGDGDGDGTTLTRYLKDNKASALLLCFQCILAIVNGILIAMSTGHLSGWARYQAMILLGMNSALGNFFAAAVSQNFTTLNKITEKITVKHRGVFATLTHVRRYIIPTSVSSTRVSIKDREENREQAEQDGKKKIFRFGLAFIALGVGGGFGIVGLLTHVFVPLLMFFPVLIAGGIILIDLPIWVIIKLDPTSKFVVPIVKLMLNTLATFFATGFVTTAATYAVQLYDGWYFIRTTS